MSAPRAVPDTRTLKSISITLTLFLWFEVPRPALIVTIGDRKLGESGLSKITTWWTKNPNANIGIATGRVSNLVVIDVDDRNGGAETLEGLLDTQGEELPPTLTAVTGNGLHHYFRAPVEGLRSSSGTLGRGIDLRADGGCVVAPPSLHSNGKIYEFVDREAELAELPSWICDRLQTQNRPQANIGGEFSIPEGMRNNHLARIAGQLRRKGFNFSEIHAELVVINSRFKPPLPEYEVDAIAKSIARYPDGAALPGRKASHGSPLYWFKLDVNWCRRVGRRLYFRRSTLNKWFEEPYTENAVRAAQSERTAV